VGIMAACGERRQVSEKVTKKCRRSGCGNEELRSGKSSQFTPDHLRPARKADALPRKDRAKMFHVKHFRRPFV
jgi:hypothetical protein